MPRDERAAIRTSGLGRDFGGAVALAGLDLAVERGEILALLGHNGAGKTTTIRLLNGVLPPSRGGATVLGLDPWRDGRALRHRTGVATERPSLDARLTARANLRLFAGLHGIPVREEGRRIDAALDRFGLLADGERRVGAYSKGMRQRLALARCALHDPELYLLDEPSAGLDPVAARDLRAWTRDLARERGRTVVLCTHDLSEAARLADRVAILRRGRLAALGTPAELAARYGAERLDVDVVPEDAPLARDALQAAGFVLAGPGAGAGALSLVGAGRDRAPDAARALVDAGVRLVRLAPVDATLEDVYLALHDAGSSAAAA